MPRLLVYVLTCDKGKAPKVIDGACILKGCKKRTIEKHAERDDWIIGIGGKTLSRRCKGKNYRKKLIYAMKVSTNNHNSPKSSYFTHYGNKAILIKGFKDISNVKRTKYFEDSKLYQKFDSFMAKERIKGRKGKISSYCCEISCKSACMH